MGFVLWLFLLPGGWASSYLGCYPALPKPEWTVSTTDQASTADPEICGLLCGQLDATPYFAIHGTNCYCSQAWSSGTPQSTTCSASCNDIDCDAVYSWCAATDMGMEGHVLSMYSITTYGEHQVVEAECECNGFCRDDVQCQFWSFDSGTKTCKLMHDFSGQYSTSLSTRGALVTPSRCFQSDSCLEAGLQCRVVGQAPSGECTANSCCTERAATCTDFLVHGATVSVGERVRFTGANDDTNGYFIEILDMDDIEVRVEVDFQFQTVKVQGKLVAGAKTASFAGTYSSAVDLSLDRLSSGWQVSLDGELQRSVAVAATSAAGRSLKYVTSFRDGWATICDSGQSPTTSPGSGGAKVFAEEPPLGTIEWAISFFAIGVLAFHLVYQGFAALGNLHEGGNSRTEDELLCLCPLKCRLCCEVTVRKNITVFQVVVAPLCTLLVYALHFVIVALALSTESEDYDVKAIATQRNGFVLGVLPLAVALLLHDLLTMPCFCQAWDDCWRLKCRADGKNEHTHCCAVAIPLAAACAAIFLTISIMEVLPKHYAYNNPANWAMGASALNSPRLPASVQFVEFSAGAAETNPGAAFEYAHTYRSSHTAFATESVSLYPVYPKDSNSFDAGLDVELFSTDSTLCTVCRNAREDLGVSQAMQAAPWGNMDTALVVTSAAEYLPDDADAMLQNNYICFGVLWFLGLPWIFLGSRFIVIASAILTCLLAILLSIIKSICGVDVEEKCKDIVRAYPAKIRAQRGAPAPAPVPGPAMDIGGPMANPVADAPDVPEVPEVPVVPEDGVGLYGMEEHQVAEEEMLELPEAAGTQFDDEEELPPPYADIVDDLPPYTEGGDGVQTDDLEQCGLNYTRLCRTSR